MTPRESVIAAMTPNDRRVLSSIGRIADGDCPDFDGWAPHGSADSVAVQRLLRSGLIRSVGWGVCMDCDSPRHRREPTEVPLYILTDAGRAALDALERATDSARRYAR